MNTVKACKVDHRNLIFAAQVLNVPVEKLHEKFEAARSMGDDSLIVYFYPPVTEGVWVDTTEDSFDHYWQHDKPWATWEFIEATRK